jgi:hypothetical protein
MLNIAAYHKWLVKEDIFGVLRSHPVPFPVLVGVGIVPVKPDAILQRIRCRHNSVYDQHIHNLRVAGGSNPRSAAGALVGWRGSSRGNVESRIRSLLAVRDPIGNNLPRGRLNSPDSVLP